MPNTLLAALARRGALPTLLAALLASLGGCDWSEGTGGGGRLPETFDVVVYGGTSAAVTAAAQVRRMGKSVVVVSPDRHLGGLSSGGLGWTDTGDKSVIGGLAREFYHRCTRTQIRK